MIQFLTLFQILLLGAWSHPIQEASALEIQIEELKNTKGQLCILVFETEDGYPDDFRKAIKQMIVPISASQVRVVFEDLKHGKYVFTVLHDENKNNVMDKNLFGKPTEGYGVSNNPEPALFGPPEFSEGIVDFKQDQQVTIRIRY